MKDLYILSTDIGLGRVLDYDSQNGWHLQWPNMEDYMACLSKGRVWHKHTRVHQKEINVAT